MNTIVSNKPQIGDSIKTGDEPILAPSAETIQQLLKVPGIPNRTKKLLRSSQVHRQLEGEKLALAHLKQRKAERQAAERAVRAEIDPLRFRASALIVELQALPPAVTPEGQATDANLVSGMRPNMDAAQLRRFIAKLERRLNQRQHKLTKQPVEVVSGPNWEALDAKAGPPVTTKNPTRAANNGNQDAKSGKSKRGKK